MSVTYEDALETLQSMFPKWDKGALEVLLQENGNYVERTVDVILAMESDLDPTIQRDDSVSSGQHEAGFSSGGNADIRRGKPCRLPDGFLQPPDSWKQSSETFGDEQLAILLQNEMFQREVQSTLGSDFMSRSQRGRNNDYNATRDVVFGSMAGGPRRLNNGAAPGAIGGAGADLGILKSLNSMSAVAKRNLSNLAMQFSKHTTAERSNEEERDRLVTDEGFTRSPFQRGQNDDDADEVITFEGNPSHNLPRSNPTLSSRRHTSSFDDYSDQSSVHYKTSAELIAPTSAKNK